MSATMSESAPAAEVECPPPIVRGVEVWRPADGGLLRLGDESPSDPGTAVNQAVSTRLPAIESGGDGPPMVAIPAFEKDELRGVVSLLLDEVEDGQGAVELWRPNERGELARGDAWYSGLERFGLVSGYVKFPRRAGLPGKVWADRFPRVMGDLAKSSDFVRVAGAKAEGLSMALGVPFMKTALEIDAVLLLLSASSSPLARVMEVWAPDPETGDLKVVSADYGPYVDLAPMSRRRRVKPGECLAGRVFADRAPWMTTDLLGVEFPCGARLGEYGFGWGVGLPVIVAGELFAVVTLLA